MRVTDSEVKQIFETTIDTSPFILTANTMINATLLTAGFSEDVLKQIELYLSAHFACALDPRERKITMGESGAEFEGRMSNKTDITSTYYGQLANTMSNGILARITKTQATVIML